MSTTTPAGNGPVSSAPEGVWKPLRSFARLARRPLERFLRLEAASGILLLLAAALALLWANSPWVSSYQQLLHTPFGVRIGAFSFERSFEWVVNDGLMVIFFFVVGLEIRRELHEGELSEWRRAALPAAAALGGMLAPAALYLSIAGASAAHTGWGIPMATDIAFVLGALALLGPRCPGQLRLFLLTVAIVDDIGAILVIAIFYSDGLSLPALFAVAVLVAALAAVRWLRIWRTPAYGRSGWPCGWRC